MYVCMYVCNVCVYFVHTCHTMCSHVKSADNGMSDELMVLRFFVGLNNVFGLFALSLSDNLSQTIHLVSSFFCFRLFGKHVQQLCARRHARSRTWHGSPNGTYELASTGVLSSFWSSHKVIMYVVAVRPRSGTLPLCVLERACRAQLLKFWSKVMLYMS